MTDPHSEIASLVNDIKAGVATLSRGKPSSTSRWRKIDPATFAGHCVQAYEQAMRDKADDIEYGEAPKRRNYALI
ncbi:hypothetical protein HDU93_006920, partial [Gonapodya sp. JEL0774]